MSRLCVLILILILICSGCSTRSDLAPVVELKWQPQDAYRTTHTVQHGETLYAIAFRYDQDYRKLAALNHLHRPYALRIGQRLRVNASSSVDPKRLSITLNKSRKQTSYSSPKVPYYSQQTTHRVGVFSMGRQHWCWPLKGQVIAKFFPEQGKKGIDIAGRKGDKVHAAANGVVAYAGSGLSGYGNLIIIKHDGQFLTAYGNNSRNIVNEGQQVKAGQIIAEIGVIDRRFWGVHFEIRKAGKPVNPLSYFGSV